MEHIRTFTQDGFRLDLWETGRREQVPEWYRGYCGEYAQALKNKYPHLRFGYYFDPSDSHYDPDETGRVIHQPQHVFVHDSDYAYDIFGSHPLPYEPYGSGTSAYDVPEDQIEFQAMWTWEPNAIERAQEEIEQNDPFSNS